jgi:hypothetical protein
MRELGEGMKRIFELMTANELQKPKLLSEGTSFTITLPHRSVFSAQQEQWLLMFQQFNLTPLQKKILVLGMNDREVSPSDIYKAINTKDRNTYDFEVTGLRVAGILIEIRTNVQSTRYARANRIPKSDVPRFKVQLPTLPGSELRTPAKPRPKPSELTRSGGNSTKAFAKFDPDVTAYISNLPYNVKRFELMSLLGKVEPPSSLHLPLAADGQTRGMAFANFSGPEVRDRVIEQFNQTSFGNRTIYLQKYDPSHRLKIRRQPARP